MQLRQCGKHNLKLPVLGMGCWAYGGGEYWGAQSQEDVNAVVRYAVDHGCIFFDTAEAYNKGASETSLGLALKGIPRDRVLIGTKISPSNVEPKTLVEHCDASLRRLQTDHVDLYMVHWPITAHSIKHFTTEAIPTPSVSDAFATLMRLRKAGKIRHIGVSNFGVAKLSEALATGAEIVINELPYSLLTRAIEMEILPFCRDHGIGVLGYMSLLQGVLADIFPTLDDVPVWQRRTRHFDSRRTPECRHGLPGAEPETNAALESIRAIARKHGMTTPELALKWAFAGKGITSSLCGSRSVKELQINIKAASEPLGQGIIEELNRATQPLLEKLGPSFDYYENPANDRTK
ncbi:MAG: aldo/keto reductase [Verrucomicrobiota bacterium]|jgi:aryl-alcohol dehydrogenase-like predicted oxidoreductase